MSLQVWLPLNGNLHNQGLNGNLEFSAINTLTFNNDGKIGKSYQRATNNTQVTTGININSNLLDLLGTEASVAVWVKPLGTHTHYNGTLLSSGNWNAKRWAFGVSQDNTKVDVLCGGYNTYIDCSVPVNQWTHLCSTFDNGISKLYKNGVYIGQLTGRPNFDSDATNTCIGRETYASGYFGFNGLINDMRIYDHCLSDKEVEEIAKGLILHYKLDDNVLGNPNLFKGTIMRPIDRTNFVSNSSTDWTKYLRYYNGNASIHTFTEEDGIYIDTVKLNSAANLGICFGRLASEINLDSSSYYTISCEAKCTKAGAGIDIGLSYLTTSDSWVWRGGSNRKLFNNTTDWQFFTHTFKPDSNTKAINYCFTVLGVSNGTDTLSIRKCKLEKGSVATSWFPAPEDMGINGNTIYDSSGYNYNGTIVGDLTTNINNSRYSYSTIFNGTSRIVADSLPAETKTLTCWAKTTKNKSTSQQIVADSNSALTISFYQGTIIGVFGTTRSTGSKSTLGSEYKENDWNFFAVVKTSDDGKRDIYCNGVKLTPTSNDYWGAATGFFIGARNASQGNPFYGEISDVRAYATALTADQILELYNTSATIDNKGNIYAREVIE